MTAPGRRSDATPLVASCVWRATPELIVTLDGRFGEPVDTYVNGSQVWIRDDGPDGVVLEWRLHPVAGYRRPAGMATEEVFASVALAFGIGTTPAVPLERLWDGLEVFAASTDDDVSPLALAAAAVASLDLVPDAVGFVDHQRIGDEWERTGGAVSVTTDLLAQLGAHHAGQRPTA
jgi:hypothetical protein